MRHYLTATRKWHAFQRILIYSRIECIFIFGMIKAQNIGDMKDLNQYIWNVTAQCWFHHSNGHLFNLTSLLMYVSYWIAFYLSVNIKVWHSRNVCYSNKHFITGIFTQIPKISSTLYAYSIWAACKRHYSHDKRSRWVERISRYLNRWKLT